MVKIKMGKKYDIPKNMFFGIAIGDVFGAGYEFAYKDITLFEKHFDISDYRKNPNKKLKYSQGMYTDDTQMSIAIAELLINDNEFNHENLANYFVDCFKRDPIIGYAKGFQSFLESIDSGEEFLKKIRPNSERNGAAMRAVPIGIIKDIETVVNYAIINAETTHNTKKGIASSVAISLLSNAYFYNNGNIALQDLLNHIRPIDIETSDHLKSIADMGNFDSQLMCGEKYKDMGIPLDAMRTIEAVLYLLSKYSEPKDILKGAILLGGDTDSVASISLGIAMINKSISDLPASLYDNLTNHRYGRDYLLDLGKKLGKKYL